MARVLDEMTFTVTRRPGDWVDGVWVPDPTSTFTINASRPQPVGPEQMEMLPEGARSSARFQIYAEDDQAEIYLVGRDREGFAADTVAYNGEDFLVTALGDWSGMPLGYKTYILIEFAPDEETT